jgi:hypothetical protein
MTRVHVARTGAVDASARASAAVAEARGEAEREDEQCEEGPEGGDREGREQHRNQFYSKLISFMRITSFGVLPFDPCTYLCCAEYRFCTTSSPLSIGRNVPYNRPKCVLYVSCSPPTTRSPPTS